MQQCLYISERRGDQDEDGVGRWVALEDRAEVFGEGITPCKATEVVERERRMAREVGVEGS